jgi:hypothetical protein
MQLDSRYDLIEVMIAKGNITQLSDIFKYIPKTVVAKNLGIKVARFSAMIKKVQKFRLEELFQIARHCKITRMRILQLAEAEYGNKRTN